MADRVGLEPAQVTYVKRFAIAIAPFYWEKINTTAIALENREVERVARFASVATEPQDNIATVAGAFKRLKEEFLK